MMAHHVTPLVVNNILRLPGITCIQVGSRRWFNWLQTATTFSYHFQAGLIALPCEERSVAVISTGMPTSKKTVSYTMFMRVALRH
jgi:hypothetical protein